VQPLVAHMDSSCTEKEERCQEESRLLRKKWTTSATAGCKSQKNCCIFARIMLGFTHFSHPREILCEKNSAFECSADGDNSTQRLLSSLENLCENRTCRSDGSKAPYRPMKADQTNGILSSRSLSYKAACTAVGASKNTVNAIPGLFNSVEQLS